MPSLYTTNFSSIKKIIDKLNLAISLNKDLNKVETLGGDLPTPKQKCKNCMYGPTSSRQTEKSNVLQPTSTQARNTASTPLTM